MRLGAADRQEDAALASPVHDLAAHAGRHADALVGAELALTVRQAERQRAREDHVDLLLPFVRVDAPALARSEADEVQAERPDAELGAKALEAIASTVVEAAVRDPVLHGGASPSGVGAQTRRPRVRFGAAMTRRAITALLLAGCLGTGLVACGSDDDGTSGDTSTTASGPQRAAKDVNVAGPDEPQGEALRRGAGRQAAQEARCTVDLVEGTGPAAKTGDTVKVKYVGLGWSTGQEFDASWDRGDTLDVELGAGSVIPGWDQGLVGIKKGGRRLLVVPPNLAYGEQGQPPTIGANETLVFVIDAVSVTPKKS